MKTKITEGDIFSVPLDQDRTGYGQVVEMFAKMLPYCVFYSGLTDKGTVLEFSKPLLAGLTANAKIKNGDWPLIGNERRNLGSILRPNFKVTISDNMYVVDFTGRHVEKYQRRNQIFSRSEV